MTSSRFAWAIGLVTACVFSSPASALTSELDSGLPTGVVRETETVADRTTSALEVATASADPIVSKINRVRRRSGRRPLRGSGRLSRTARRFGRHLMRINRFAHDSHIWGGGRYRRVGEILALHRGWRARRSRTVRGWRRSSTHRAVLLGRFRMVGVACVRGRFGSRRATIWVAQFAR
jgi:uncharacterized protein YkwD